eukprot:scaffold55253_cov61-Phaeocystis_antarctica.AAC.31
MRGSTPGAAARARRAANAHGPAPRATLWAAPPPPAAAAAAATRAAPAIRAVDQWPALRPTRRPRSAGLRRPGCRQCSASL